MTPELANGGLAVGSLLTFWLGVMRVQGHIDKQVERRTKVELADMRDQLDKMEVRLAEFQSQQERTQQTLMKATLQITEAITHLEPAAPAREPLRLATNLILSAMGARA